MIYKMQVYIYVDALSLAVRDLFTISKGFLIVYIYINIDKEGYIINATIQPVHKIKKNI